jgi:hypothetical protein
VNFCDLVGIPSHIISPNIPKALQICHSYRVEITFSQDVKQDLNFAGGKGFAEHLASVELDVP